MNYNTPRCHCAKKCLILKFYCFLWELTIYVYTCPVLMGNILPIWPMVVEWGNNGWRKYIRNVFCVTSSFICSPIGRKSWFIEKLFHNNSEMQISLAISFKRYIIVLRITLECRNRNGWHDAICHALILVQLYATCLTWQIAALVTCEWWLPDRSCFLNIHTKSYHRVYRNTIVLGIRIVSIQKRGP